MEESPVEAAAFVELVTNGDVEAVRRELKNRPGLARTSDKIGVSVLLLALYRGFDDIAEAVMGAGFELSLFEAAAVGQINRIKTILHENPSSANQHSSDGFTALQLASFFGRVEAVNLLLASGADPNIPSVNPMNVRPINSAAAARDAVAAETIVKALIDRGGDVNVKQQGGWTPLHQAAARGLLGMMSVLLDHGATPSVPNDEGFTALQLALRNGHGEAAALLRRRKQ